jgi:hypothetical protein
MSRRSFVFMLILAMSGATIGGAWAALRPPPLSDPSDAAFAQAVQRQEQPDADLAGVDLLAGVGPVALPGSTPEVADPDEHEPGPRDDLAALWRRLADLGYYVGPIDGGRGQSTRAMRGAVMAFQKVNGLRADGRIGPATLAALESPSRPSLRGGPAKRVEVDLDKQVLYYVEGDRIVRIMPVSSGNGSSYEREDGGVARSLTPVGTFRIQHTIRGVREADLGTLYDPMYFYQGWAIHGSNSVPAYPASHGCIRVSRADALWLQSRMPVGTTVMVYGGSHTFTPGSSAPGTTTPAGDDPTDAADDSASQEELGDEDLSQPAPAEDAVSAERAAAQAEGGDTNPAAPSDVDEMVAQEIAGG